MGQQLPQMPLPQPCGPDGGPTLMSLVYLLRKVHGLLEEQQQGQTLNIPQRHWERESDIPEPIPQVPTGHTGGYRIRRILDTAASAVCR